MRIMLLLLCCAVSFMAVAQHKDEVLIKQMLNQQTKQWNKGMISGFMVGYWQSDSLMFIGQSGLRYGYTNTLENYKRSYPDTAHMGKLTSTVLTMRRLSPVYYFVTGKWQLQRSVGNAEGYYTLLLQKIKGKWVIIADHSS